MKKQKDEEWSKQQNAIIDFQTQNSEE